MQHIDESVYVCVSHTVLVSKNCLGPGGKPPGLENLKKKFVKLKIAFFH